MTLEGRVRGAISVRPLACVVLFSVAAGAVVAPISPAEEQSSVSEAEEPYVEPPWLADTRQYFLIQDHKEGKKWAVRSRRPKLHERTDDEMVFILESGRAVLAERRVDGQTILAISKMLQRTKPSPEVTKFIDEFLSKDLTGKRIDRNHYRAMTEAIAALGLYRSDDAFKVLFRVSQPAFWEKRVWASVESPPDADRWDPLDRLRAEAAGWIGEWDPEIAEPALLELAEIEGPGSRVAEVIDLRLEVIDQRKRGVYVRDSIP
ncbi:MAG: hypothetical protein GY851_34010 [bacterium]|nr:hypothetical protein [bacterium]